MGGAGGLTTAGAGAADLLSNETRRVRDADSATIAEAGAAENERTTGGAVKSMSDVQWKEAIGREEDLCQSKRTRGAHDPRALGHARQPGQGRR